jgi:uncharacterized metal-binding protein (TIGR02443 family)
MTNEIKKRFVAGAVCPRCGLMDKIVLYRVDDHEYRECVSCDFKDEMRFKPAVRELETRVNKSEQEKAEETQVVKFIAPGSDQGSR